MMKRKNLCDDLREQTSQEKEKHVLGPVTEESLVCSGGKDPPHLTLVMPTVSFAFPAHGLASCFF